MSSEDFSKSLVLDCGSGFTKAGVSDIDITNRVIPTVWSSHKDGSHMFGDDSISHRKELPIKRLFDREFISDWDLVGQYWSYVVRKEMKMEPAAQPVMVGCHHADKKEYKERVIKIFMEEMGCKGFYICGTGLLSLYGSGKLQGIVVDSGDGTTTVVASQEGLINDHQDHCLKVAGQDIDAHIKALLHGKIEDREFIRNIKHNKCRLESEGTILKKNQLLASGAGEVEQPYTLPDGSTVNITGAVVAAPDILFNPRKVGVRKPGIHELVYDCVHQSDYDSRRDLFNNIIVSGGNFNIPGLTQK